MEQNEQFSVKREDMQKYVQKAWQEMQGFLHDQRKKYGNRYNSKNDYEQIDRRFDNAHQDPQKFLDEFMLIQQKRSSQPASVRTVIQHIGARAFQLATIDAQANQAQQKHKEENNKS